MSTTGSPWRPLFERLLDELDGQKSPDWQAAKIALDPKVYYDGKRFQAVREQLFRRLPLCLGHIDQLAEPGAVLALDLCGTPVLLGRGADGEVRVFLNVCRHRGARLVTQQAEVCRRHRLVCPYHGWTYRLDRSLAGVPRGEAFPDLNPHLLGLWQLPSSVRHGLIWAVLDPAADAGPLDVEAYLGELDPSMRSAWLTIAFTASTRFDAPATGN